MIDEMELKAVYEFPRDRGSLAGFHHNVGSLFRTRKIRALNEAHPQEHGDQQSRRRSETSIHVYALLYWIHVYVGFYFRGCPLRTNDIHNYPGKAPLAHDHS